MVNKGSEDNKLGAKLKPYNDEEMIKLLKKKRALSKRISISHQMIEIEQKDHYQKRIKVSEEENIRLQNENQRLQLEKNDLISQLKVIKKITEAY